MKESSDAEEKTTESGVTHTLIYCRVSSTKQTTEGSGLETQETRCRQYAERKGYVVDKVFPDDVTGGGDYMTRPGMVALLSHLDANPDIEYVVIFDDLKRFARDTLFHLKLRQTLAMRGARVECLNFRFEDSPEGKFNETIMAACGELEREQNARQAIQKTKARLSTGYYCRSKASGYKYEKVPGHGKMLVPDEDKAPAIIEAFEGFASERFETVAEVARYFRKHPNFSNNVSRQSATNILRRPLYAGYIHIPNYGFHMYPGKHQPLVSLALWQKVQDRLDGKKKRPARKDIHKDFPLRNFIACEGCGRAMTSCWTKGGSGKRYGYYTCQTEGCEYRGKSIRREPIHDAFGTLVRTMAPSTALMKVAKAMFTDIWTARMNQLREAKAAIGDRINGVEARKQTLVKRLVAATTDAVVPVYEKELANLEHEKRLMEEEAARALEPAKPFAESFGLAMDFLSKPWVLWENGDLAARRLLLRLSLPAPIVYNRENGFSNAEFALPFSTLGGADMQNLQMVRSRGIELSAKMQLIHCFRWHAKP